MQLSQREVDIFFGLVSDQIRTIAKLASRTSCLKVTGLSVEFDEGQVFKVGIDQIVYNAIDDPKFMISIPYEVEK